MRGNRVEPIEAVTDRIREAVGGSFGEGWRDCAGEKETGVGGVPLSRARPSRRDVAPVAPSRRGPRG